MGFYATESSHGRVEDGLGYWGCRYYSVALGRWVSRDPAEENGGDLLYGYCGNDGVGAWDYLGLEKQPSARATAESFIGKYRMSVSDTLVAESTLIASFLDRIAGAMGRNVTVEFGDQDQYTRNPYSRSSTITLQRQGTQGSTFHELVHSYNDRKANIRDDREDEGLAYIQQYIVNGIWHLAQLEKYLKTSHSSCAEKRRVAKAHWQLAWTTMSDYVGAKGEIFHMFRPNQEFYLQDEDVRRLANVYGVTVSGEDIEELFNGLDFVGECCFTFSAHVSAPDDEQTACPEKELPPALR